MHLQTRPLIVVVSGPSGVGKGTVVRKLVQADPATLLSVSVTTRAPRPQEIDGVDYHFISPDRFQAMRKGHELVEWAEVYRGGGTAGEFYGTPLQPVEEALANGRDVILEIEVQGAKQVKQWAQDPVLVFVLPPSWEELERRLTQRNTEGPQKVLQRLETAQVEFRRLWDYDYFLVNDTIEQTTVELEAIVEAERHRVRRIVSWPQERMNHD
ncbi:MAG: guanylate kinase [Coprothermobacterota bacterium]|nr:guanylate kinase [Coprothermobacterota bacterium]